MNKQLLIVAILGALMVCSTFAKEESHIGYQLIKNLQTDILDQIDELDNQWKVQKDLLTRNVDSWARTVTAQQSLCDGRAGDLAQTDKDIENTQGYIAWIEKQIDQNNARVQTLEELRCQANTLYINGIKNNKLSLSLIEYLYREISRVENLEMLQKMHVMTKLTLFIQAYKLGNVASLLDGSVFAQFKSHLRTTDGEELEEEAEDSLEEDNEDALNEIENELNDDENSGEGNETYALGGANDGEEESETQHARTTGQRPRVNESEGSSEGNNDGEDEWEDEDEEEEEQEEEEFEEDDEEVIAAAGSAEGEEDSEEESSGEHHSAHHGSHHAAAEGDDEEEGSEETSAGRSGYSSSGSSGSGEQEGSHGSVPQHGHVDWNVDTTSWPQYKKDLLEILVRLRNSILQKMKTAQDDEVNAGIALADYKVIIHRENEDLANALTNQQERLEELLVLQTKQQIRLTECQAELSTVSDSLYASKAELENSEAQYTENRKAAVEERDIYDYVVSIYEGKVEDRFRFKNDNKGRQLDNINF